MAVDIKSYPCTHEIVERIAQEAPDDIALIRGNKKLTFGEYNKLANQLAHWLIRRGVRPGDNVVVLMERSLEFAIAVFGVLKAGAAYVPISPTLPPERIMFILQDTEAVIVLSHRSVREANHLQVDFPFVYLGEELTSISKQPSDNPGLDLNSEQRCYVSYTSGSTGQPKGVVVPHRSMLGFLFDERMPFLGAKLVMLQHSSIMWDAFVLEFWAVLANGGTSILYEGSMLTPENLRELILHNQIQVLWLTTSLFNMLVDLEEPVLEGISLLMVGGEALSVPHITRAQSKYPKMRLINGYGPSECVVFSSCYIIPPDFDPSEKSVPIGTAIGDRRLYLLDAERREVSDGEVGELYIGGPGVAHGYLKRPELTAQHFMPDPFVTGNGQMYRTGDLVRRRPDHLLEFLGRADKQVKIRGNLVELNEVESVLQKHSDIKQVAVVLCTINGQVQLVCYYVPFSVNLTPVELRAFMEEHVPSYMIPALFYQMETLPLTVNGKLDRSQLPAPEIAPEQIQPRTETEKQVAEIWAEVLSVNDIGVETHFFELGGNSLLAMQIHTRLNRKFNLNLPIGEVLLRSTVAQIAELIDEKRSQGVVHIAAGPQLVARERRVRIEVKHKRET